MKNFNTGAVWLVAAALASLGTLGARAALAADAAVQVAQSTAKDDSELNLNEVTVTARRREESIVDVPLAISVISARQLEKLNITTTNQLANFVPGLEFNDFTPGYSRNDRGGTRALVFRGLAIGLGSGSTGVTSAGGMFLDGAAVVGGEIPASMDIGAVEILRGPQSVYFGRATMTGAVSYRTKAIPDSWQVDSEADIAQRDERDFQVSAAGPIVPGLLGARISGLSQSTDGYVNNGYNNGNSKLGARKRDSISGTVDFTPLDALEVKGYLNYFEDEDGPAATAFIPSQFSNCKQPGAARLTFCGQIPDPSNSIYYLNTTIPPNFAQAIFASPLISDAGFKKQIGLQRDVLASHLIVNYRINDYLKFQSITGYHTNNTLQASDGIGQPVTRYFTYSQYDYTIDNKSRDFSEELRLSSDPSRPLSWTLGANYVNAVAAVEAIVAFGFQATGAFLPLPQSITYDKTKTSGYFGGVYYKLLDDRLTLSAEGRYQQDKRAIDSTTIAGVVTSAAANTFNSFNPRFSADYDVGGGRKVYVSYATGTRPGGFNTTLAGYLNTYANNPTVISQLGQYLGDVSFTYAEEKLKIEEIGFKGNFPNGNGYFDINAYAGKLTNQQVPFGALIPALGFTVTATENIGETTIHGVEWQSDYRFTRDWSLATTAAWNYAQRNQYLNPAGITQFGTTNLSGVKMANSPEFTGSAVISYEHPLLADWLGFSNLDIVYRGKQFMDAANLSWIKGRTQLDLRAGASKDKVRVELFVMNLLNDQNYTGGNVATDFGGAGDANGAWSGRAYAFFGGVAPPRQVGMRVNYRF